MRLIAPLCLSVLLTGCMQQIVRLDIHSYAVPEQARVTHVDLDLDVHFATRTLEGTATLTVDGKGPLTLDTRDLAILRVQVRSLNTWLDVEYQLGAVDKFLGQPLAIAMPEDGRQVRVTYRTSPKASALQWLEPAQTAGKKYPMLFTQSESIHARSWIPLQDSPGIRVTYQARIRTGPELFAIMSADNSKNKARTGDYTFEMKQPIPAYLIALAVGDIAYRPLSKRTGVYAEPSIVDAAAREFADTEKMVQAVEGMYGPYRWEQYDIFVGPPSFPIGGMENPRLTFATPTILAGDKSLVNLIAHELAHSWSGNLVTNATWSDFWLNEGFTVYLENRIQERLYGPERAAKERLIEWEDLKKEMADLPEADEILHVNLTGRDPDDGFTQVPYIKGAQLLRTIEQAVGRERFDGFLKDYFASHAFRSITTSDMLQYLRARLPEASHIDLQKWIYEPGLPAGAPVDESVFATIDQAALSWAPGTALNAQGWSTQDWLRLLRRLPTPLGAEKMKSLDDAHKLTATGNFEILTQWLDMSIRNGYQPGLDRVEWFLTTVGRQKMVKPIYRALNETGSGKARAQALFAKARPMYHPLTVTALETLLK